MLAQGYFFWRHLKQMPQWYLMFVLMVVVLTWVSLLHLMQVGIEQSMVEQSAQLLGGDLRVRSERTMPDLWRQQARSMGIDSTQTQMFRSMVSVDDHFSLVLVKAIDQGFPQKQAWQWQSKPMGNIDIPGPSEVWLSLDAAIALGADIGDQVTIGYHDFLVTAVLMPDLEQMGNWFEFSPRVYMRLDDVDATQVIQPGSLTYWHWYFSGSSEAIMKLKQDLLASLEPYEIIETQQDSQFRKNLILDRIFNYLRWFGVMNVGLMAVMLVLLTQRYVANSFRWLGVTVAFGISVTRACTYLIGIYVALVVLAWFLAMVIASMGYHLLSMLLLEYWPHPMAALDIKQLLWIGLLSLMVMAGLTLPMLLKMLTIKPVEFLSGKDTSGLVIDKWVCMFGLLSMMGLFWLQFNQLSLGLVGLVLWAGILSLVSVGIWVVQVAITTFQTSCSWSTRFALANLRFYMPSYRVYLMALVASLSLWLTCLILTQCLTEFLGLHYHERSPNYFAINIAKQDHESFDDFLQTKDWQVSTLYPAIRGRLVEVNGQSVGDYYGDDRIKDDYLLRRPLNLSATETLPISNELISGQWHSKLDQLVGVSVADSYANRFGLKLGDRVTLLIGANTLTATITSLRAVDWYSFQPNFFMLFQPSVLEKYPSTWLTSFYVPPNEINQLPQLLKMFPNLTLINVGGMIKQLVEVVNYFSFFSSFLLGLSLIFAWSLMMGVIKLQSKQRQKDIDLIRRLGGSQHLVHRSYRTEKRILGWMVVVFSLSMSYVLVSFLLDRLNLSFVWGQSAWISFIGWLSLLVAMVYVTQKSKVEV